MRRVLLSVAFALVAAALACDKRSLPPTAPGAPGGPDAPSRSLVRVEVSGPFSVDLGGTAQFVATARYSDGSSRDVSSEAAWRTQQSLVLTISETGLATGRSAGETTVSAGFQGRGSTTGQVVVTSPGTYRLLGSVRDSGLPVSGAEVAVSAGPAEGLTATTVNGTYRLYGVHGDAEVRVRRPGYESRRSGWSLLTTRLSTSTLTSRALATESTVRGRCQSSRPTPAGPRCPTRRCDGSTGPCSPRMGRG